MRTALITVDAPEPFLELGDAKKHLRVDIDDEDDLIQSMIAAVCGALDGPDGNLKCALGAQSLKLVLPAFVAPSSWGGNQRRLHTGTRIELPLPPASAVTAVQYYDSDGIQQTLDAALYNFVECGTSPSFVIPATGTCWPAAACRPDAVSITFAAGFADDDGIPAPIKAAAKLMLGDLYATREATVYSTGAALENPAVKALLSPWRILKL